MAPRPTPRERLLFAQVDVVVGVGVQLVLHVAPVPAPGGAELEHRERARPPQVGITALQYAVEPELGAAGGADVPLDLVPLTQGDGRQRHVGVVVVGELISSSTRRWYTDPFQFIEMYMVLPPMNMNAILLTPLPSVCHCAEGFHQKPA